MRKMVVIFVMVIAFFIMSGCTADPNPLVDTANSEGEVAGFWLGLWHGFIAMFTFVISLFSNSITVYEVHNNGNWYNFGFIFGVMMFFGGGSGGACKGSRKR